MVTWMAKQKMPNYNILLVWLSSKRRMLSQLQILITIKSKSLILSTIKYILGLETVTQLQLMNKHLNVVSMSQVALIQSTMKLLMTLKFSLLIATIIVSDMSIMIQASYILPSLRAYLKLNLSQMELAPPPIPLISLRNQMRKQKYLDQTEVKNPLGNEAERGLKNILEILFKHSHKSTESIFLL